MQIDFHHAVTYVAARIAGFQHEGADIIAYAAQYVDDATSSGTVCFENKAMYTRISSAHKMIDPKNLDNVENHLVWLPFHFLPGNGGQPAGQSPGGSFINKIVCAPGSPTVREMVRSCILDQEKPYSLHRLGVSMHVYADSWAHQGFAGVLHPVNEVENAEDTGRSGVFGGALQKFLNDILEDAVPPLGHGRAQVFPDLPFLSWSYENGQGTRVTRNNTNMFCEAADAMCKAMQDYRRQKDPNVQVTGINGADMGTIRTLFSNLKTMEGNERHDAWVNEIKKGRFSFGSAEISYAEDGKNSWKAQALGTSLNLPVHTYNDTFLTSNWKLFHDALQLHRLTVLHDILPKHGICAG